MFLFLGICYPLPFLLRYSSRIYFFLLSIYDLSCFLFCYSLVLLKFLFFLVFYFSSSALLSLLSFYGSLILASYMIFDEQFLSFGSIISYFFNYFRSLGLLNYCSNSSSISSNSSYIFYYSPLPPSFFIFYLTSFLTLSTRFLRSFSSLNSENVSKLSIEYLKEVLEAFGSYFFDLATIFLDLRSIALSLASLIFCYYFFCFFYCFTFFLYF